MTRATVYIIQRPDGIYIVKTVSDFFSQIIERNDNVLASFFVESNQILEVRKGYYESGFTYCYSVHRGTIVKITKKLNKVKRKLQERFPYFDFVNRYNKIVVRNLSQAVVKFDIITIFTQPIDELADFATKKLEQLLGPKLDLCKQLYSEGKELLELEAKIRKLEHLLRFIKVRVIYRKVIFRAKVYLKHPNGQIRSVAVDFEKPLKALHFLVDRVKWVDGKPLLEKMNI